MYFSTLNSNMLLELLLHTQFLCDRIFLNAILANLHFLTRHQYVLNTAEALYYISNIVWVWKLNQNKGSIGKHASPITDSQTVQSSGVLTRWDMKLTVERKGTEHIVTSKNSGLNGNRLFKDRKM